MCPAFIMNNTIKSTLDLFVKDVKAAYCKVLIFKLERIHNEAKVFPLTLLSLGHSKIYSKQQMKNSSKTQTKGERERTLFAEIKGQCDVSIFMTCFR